MHDLLTNNSIVRILSFFASAIGPYVALMLALYAIIYYDKISKLKKDTNIYFTTGLYRSRYSRHN